MDGVVTSLIERMIGLGSSRELFVILHIVIDNRSGAWVVMDCYND